MPFLQQPPKSSTHPVLGFFGVCFFPPQEQNNIVHGNICAKNLLLAREGDPSKSVPPFIKLSDPGISVVMLGKDGRVDLVHGPALKAEDRQTDVTLFLVIVDRIPWVAPEVLMSPDNLTLKCDKWSFGATLWELFNNGNNPLLGWDLDMVTLEYNVHVS